MNKKVKQYIVSNYFKSFNSNNVFTRLVILLFIVAAIILCLFFLYRAASNALYIYNLKTDFYKLRAIGLNVMNYNIIYCNKLKKKYIPNRVKLVNNSVVNYMKNEFKNKNVIGFFPNNCIVLDIDTKDGVKSVDFLDGRIPKDTVSEKTPNGYHYYFENDTGKEIFTYVQLKINGEKYALDILSSDALITMSPSVIDGKPYYWINSIFTHKLAKVSENMWILDLIKDNKPFNRKFKNVEFKISVKNILIIIDNIHIENLFRYYIESVKEYSRKIKLFDGVIYVYDDNYYYMTRGSFNKNNNKSKLVSDLKNTVSEINPSLIVDLSIVYTNQMKQGSVFQVTSAIIDNNYKKYKNNKMFPDYIEQNNIYKKTDYFTKNTVTICDYNTSELVNEATKELINNKNSKLFIGSESIYITMLLSNMVNIPSICLCLNYGEGNENLDEKGNSRINKDYEIKILTSFMKIF
jgi:hypothetical protein